MTKLKSPLPRAYDPLAVVEDWLDACRWANLVALLKLYDEQATLECRCQHFILPFNLNGLALTTDGVRLDYQDYEDNPIRMEFRFSPLGKILHTSCRQLDVA